MKSYDKALQTVFAALTDGSSDPAVAWYYYNVLKANVKNVDFNLYIGITEPAFEISFLVENPDWNQGTDLIYGQFTSSLKICIEDVSGELGFALRFVSNSFTSDLENSGRLAQIFVAAADINSMLQRALEEQNDE